MLKHAKNHGNWLRHFEDICRRYEPSNVVTYFLAHPVLGPVTKAYCQAVF